MREKPLHYEQAADYIEEIPKFTKKHTPEHTKEFLRRLGDPCSGRKVVHVAGTNGKGSVCAYIRAILEAEGKRTGFFTSPHLIKLNERIQIGQTSVSDEIFYQAFSEVYDVVAAMEEEGIAHPSYFEFLYGMGMKVFEESDVEYIVLETGLGGRLDATNSFQEPTLTVITSISLDHTDILGGTIEEVAAEKAGIIKSGIPLLFDGTNESAAKVLRETASRVGAPCREITKNAFEIREVNRKYIAFSRRNAYDKYTDDIWKVPICGIYQAMNAEIAIEAAEVLLKAEEVHKDRWRTAIASMHWKGRMEEAGEYCIIDGAHNPGAIEAFVESVQALGEEEPLPVILFSAVADKKYEQMIAYLCEHLPAKVYIVTEINDQRKVPAEELGTLFQKYTNRKVIVEKCIKDAMCRAYKERKGREYIYCLGSLYLAGEVEKLLSGGI